MLFISCCRMQSMNELSLISRSLLRPESRLRNLSLVRSTYFFPNAEISLVFSLVWILGDDNVDVKFDNSRRPST